MTDRPFFRRQFDSGRRRVTDQRVFQTGRSNAADPIELARAVTRAETLADCHQLAAAYERQGANAGIVRHILAQRVSQAWAYVEALREGPLDEAEPGRAPASSSGATAAGEGLTAPEGEQPAAAPLDSAEERDLRLIARGYDMALRALGVPAPESVKAPNLRVVE